MTGIYARVSTKEQAQNYSIDEQVERMVSYCNAMKWDYTVYTDAGYTGSNMNRPALQRLITAVKTGELSRVLVYKLDRLSRSQKDTLTLIEDVIMKNGCEFVSLTENLDTNTPIGKAMIGIISCFSQLEKENIKERMSMGKDARIREGKWTGGISPYGYSYTKKADVLTVDEHEAPYVRKLFEEAAAGKPFFRIMEDFNAAGYKLRYNDWSLWSLKYMLENRVYCGYIRHNGNWIKALHEPIISEELFDKVQVILENNRRQFREQGIRAGGKNYTTYLGGLIRCGVCGGKYGKRLSGAPNHRFFTYVCYSRCKKVRTMIKDPACDNKIYRVDELDKIIIDEIRKLRFTPYTEDGNEKLHLTAELNTIDKQISRLVDLYAAGRFAYAQLDEKISTLERRRDELHRQIEQKPRVSEEAAKAALDSFDDILNSGDFDAIRSVIEMLIDKIVITGENIDIYWSFQ